jgi:hypothetical protein
MGGSVGFNGGYGGIRQRLTAIGNDSSQFLT